MIKTQVARIFSPRHVALAAGAKDGVKEDMVFIIYSLGDPIMDPSTKESLGNLEIVKGRVRVFFVQDKICQAQTFSTTVTEVFDPLHGITGMRGITNILAPREVSKTVHDELKVEAVEPFVLDLTVRVGDWARSVE
jgi:hypothetical protein